MGFLVDVSVVVPIYNEEESIPHLVEQIRSAFEGRDETWELVAVNDGSADKSFDVLCSEADKDSRVVAVNFRRNFGQTAAMEAGIDHAVGDIIVFMDADLHNDPADIPMMLDKLDEGHDMVAGWRADRKDRFLDRRLPSIIANRIIGKTTGVRLHDYGCSLKAIRAEVAKELNLYGEMHRFIPALAALIGARIVEVKVNHRARQFGVSKYGIGRTLRVILDLMTVLFLQRYLVRPMQVFGLGGIASLVLGGGICVLLAVQKLFFDMALGDRPLLLLGVLMILVGVQFLSVGLVADLLARTYFESQGRASYHVRQVFAPSREASPPDGGPSDAPRDDADVVPVSRRSANA